MKSKKLISKPSKTSPLTGTQRDQQTPAKSSGANNGDSDRNAKGQFVAGNRYAWQDGQSGNPKGRPTTHEELEELIRNIGSEPQITQDGENLGSRLYILIRAMFLSRNAADHIALLEHAFGKVPQEINLTWREKAKELGYDPDELIQQFATTAAALGAGSSGNGSTGNSAAETASTGSEPSSSESAATR